MLTIGNGTDNGQPESAGTLEARIRELEAKIERIEAGLVGERSVFLKSPTPAIIYEASSLNIIDVNERALELYGYTREQFLAMNVIELFAAHSPSESMRLRTGLQDQANVMGPYLHVGAAKQELVVRLMTFALEMGGVDARVAMIQDDTMRQSADEAIRTSEERYRELFENANDVIFLQDLQGKILTINRAAESLTGYARQEVLGHAIDQLIAPEARYLHHDSIRAHLGGSATQHYELAVLSKDQNRRFLDVSSRILYRFGQPYAVQGIGRDVTERKQAQERLEQSAKALERTNEELSTALRLAREATQLKEQFLANTSHELRTPLNGIMGMINLLKTTNLTPDQRDYADTVGQCANDLLIIINDLLDLSQMDAGRLSLDEECIDLQGCLESVLKLLRVKANSKGLALSLEIDSRLPARVYADGLRLRQVVTNLVSNAVKFTSSGGVRVRLLPAQSGDAFRCEVIDSGIGVDDTVHDRIFQAFFQADGTTRRRFGGNGLGLAICKQLVEIMGGRIGLHHNEDGSAGTTFWFELPIRMEGTIPSNGETSGIISQPV